MTRYVYRPRIDDVLELMSHALTMYGHTLDEAIGYTIVEENIMPEPTDDPIWAALDFTALFVVALENVVEGMPGRQIEKWWSEYVGRYCINEDAVAAALGDEQDRQAFMRDLARVRAALGMQ